VYSRTESLPRIANKLSGPFQHPYNISSHEQRDPGPMAFWHRGRPGDVHKLLLVPDPLAGRAGLSSVHDYQTTTKNAHAYVFIEASRGSRAFRRFLRTTGSSWRLTRRPSRNVPVSAILVGNVGPELALTQEFLPRTPWSVDSTTRTRKSHTSLPNWNRTASCVVGRIRVGRSAVPRSLPSMSTGAGNPWARQGAHDRRKNDFPFAPGEPWTAE